MNIILQFLQCSSLGTGNALGDLGFCTISTDGSKVMPQREWENLVNNVREVMKATLSEVKPSEPDENTYREHAKLVSEKIFM